MHNGKQHQRCQACGRQCVVHADTRVLAEEHRSLVERVRRKNISLHGMCRAVGVGLKGLMHDVRLHRWNV